MRYRNVIMAALVSLLSACGSLDVQADDVTRFEVRGEALIMNGEITSDTLDQFEDVIAANPGIKVLIEGNVPGSSDDDTMIELAYLVRELGLATHLRADSEIYSGGVDLFLAGVSRTMEQGAKIGVHSWSDGTRDAADFPRSASEHDLNRNYIKDMLGDDAFYWFTIYAAPADDMHEMTVSEIETYKLLTAPVKPAGAGWK